jgi:hypothetical protein
MIANILNEIAKAALSYLNKFLDKTEPELDCRFDSQKLVFISGRITAPLQNQGMKKLLYEGSIMLIWVGIGLDSKYPK